jgi:hypothetical protein
MHEDTRGHSRTLEDTRGHRRTELSQMQCLPALINDQEHHEAEEAAERRGNPDPRHHVISLVEFDFQLLPFAERRRHVWRRRPRTRWRRPRRIAADTRHICKSRANGSLKILHRTTLELFLLANVRYVFPIVEHRAHEQDEVWESSEMPSIFICTIDARQVAAPLSFKDISRASHIQVYSILSYSKIPLTAHIYTCKLIIHN